MGDEAKSDYEERYVNMLPAGMRGEEGKEKGPEEESTVVFQFFLFSLSSLLSPLPFSPPSLVELEMAVWRQAHKLPLLVDLQKVSGEGLAEKSAVASVSSCSPRHASPSMPLLSPSLSSSSSSFLACIELYRCA